MTNLSISSIKSMASARMSIAAAFATLTTLVLLHILSPEFDPSWRMVSEYANGGYSWVLSLLFILWAVSSWSLASSLSKKLTTKVGKIGLLFLIISGFGEVMASFFDVNHSLHSLAALIGIGSFPFAAFLLSKALKKMFNTTQISKNLSLVAHLPWISVVLMAGSFGLLISTYINVGGDLSAGPATDIPQGVIAIVGWANRLLIVIYCVCLAYLASLSLKLKQK